MEKDEKEADEILLLVGCLSPRPSGSTFLGWQDSRESCWSGFNGSSNPGSRKWHSGQSAYLDTTSHLLQPARSGKGAFIV